MRNHALPKRDPYPPPLPRTLPTALLDISLVFPSPPHSSRRWMTSDSGSHPAAPVKIRRVKLTLKHPDVLPQRLAAVAPPPGLAPPPSTISFGSTLPRPAVKRKRPYTLQAATFRVNRQELQTHDNAGSTSRWRVDVSEPNEAGGSGVGGMPMPMPRIRFQQVQPDGNISKRVPTKRRRLAAAKEVPPPVMDGPIVALSLGSTGKRFRYRFV